MNRKVFFEEVRQSLFKGALSQSQVDGLNRYLDAMQDAQWPITWAAYGLATGFHETAFTMQPIAERGSYTYFITNYDINGRNPARARQYGNVRPGDGFRYRGRGDVQLTWFVNYERASKKLGVDLVNNPDLAMDPATSIRVMIAGMTEGWFTKHTMAQYLNGPQPNYVGARRIINGTDRANVIAQYARRFEYALKAAQYRPQRPAPTTTPIKPAVIAPQRLPEPAVVASTAPRQSWWGRLWGRKDTA
jgi:putative chitinase